MIRGLKIAALSTLTMTFVYGDNVQWQAFDQEHSLSVEDKLKRPTLFTDDGAVTFKLVFTSTMYVRVRTDKKALLHLNKNNR